MGRVEHARQPAARARGHRQRPAAGAHREAWELAEVATSRLGGIVDAYVGVKPLIASAFDAVDQTAGEDKVAKARRR
jgi:hypothetical protein